MKKLLALLIAVMMVVALVPATVLSAMTPDPDGPIQDGGEGPETPIPTPGGEDDPTVDDFVAFPEDDTPDERVEEGNSFHFDLEFTEGEDKFEVVNKDDVLVGYFKTLPEADDWVRNGDTLRFLADYTMTTRYNFGTGRGQFAKVPMSYTVDGNGHTVIYTGADDTAVTYAYALGFAGNEANHDVVVTGLKVVSARGCFELAPGSGQGMRVTIDNCEMYANDAYYYVDKGFYAANGLTYYGNQDDDGIAVRTVNTYLILKGENTKLYTGNGIAIYATGVVSVYDGEYYSSGADQTFYITGDRNYAVRGEHKLLIYGGTVVNDKLCAVRIKGGASCYIYGGNFVQTAEKSADAWSAVLRCGTSAKFDDGNADTTATYEGEMTVAQAYILGGNFYADVVSASGLGTAMPTTGCLNASTTRGAIYVAGGTFHYSGDVANGGNTNMLFYSTATKLTTATSAAGCSFTVPSIYTPTGYDTVTWQKELTVSVDADKFGGAIAADGTVADAEALATYGYEAAILDAEGKVIDLVHVDDDASNAIHKGTCDEMSGDGYTELRYTTLMTPDGGTYLLLTDIDIAGVSSARCLFDRTPGGDFTLDGNGNTLRVTVAGKYITYHAGGSNVTFLNVTIENPTGRCLEFAQNGFLPATWTLGAGTTVRSGAGSAFVIQACGILNIQEGAVVEGLPSTEAWNSLFQIHQRATLNLNGGTLRAIVSNGKDGSGNDTFINTKAVFFIGNNAANRYLNLNSGAIYLAGNSVASLIDIESVDDPFTLNLSANVVLYDHEGNPLDRPDFDAPEAGVTAADGTYTAYATLTEALAKAKAGDTVSLLRDLWSTVRYTVRTDITFLGNGFTIHDMNGVRTLPVITVTGEDLHVEISDLTVITRQSGIYVSPNTFADRGNSAAGLDANDLKKISVVLNNCRFYTGAVGTNSFDSINNAEGTDDIVCATNTTAGALLMHGEGVYVQILGEDGLYASSTAEAVVNFGGYLDIYDGTFYSHSATQTLWLRGRRQLTANSNNQIENATTAIYGGQFIAGPFVDMSVARSAQGHTMVIAGGEFLMMEGGNETKSTKNDRQTIRASESNTAAYVYILGGNFYNTSSCMTNLGAGNYTVGYFNIFGGNFFTNYYNAEDATADELRNFRVENNPYSTRTFTIANAVNAYGVQVYDGYRVDTYHYPDASKYPADTKLEYVKNGYSYLQSVVYNEQWLEENGYLEEGIAYQVTNGQSNVPEKFYSFELERALLYLGNGGTFTLMRDVTLRQPGKNTAGEEPDTDYGFTTRGRHGDTKVTFNSAAIEGYYTLTATATNTMLLSVRGGYFLFENIGLVNTAGRVICLEDAAYSTLHFTGGYYSANDIESGNGNMDTIATGNEAKAVLIVEGGTFTGNQALFALDADDTYVVFGVEGTQQGPTLIQNGAQALWVGNTNNLTITFYYATFNDIGTGGKNINIAGSAQNLDLIIYDGIFYCNNKGNEQILATANGSTVDITIYGGTFLRGNTGPGTVGYGKLMIFEGNGTVNIYGGSFRTLVSNNTIFTIRNNENFTLNIGDPTTGEGPTFQSNGGHAIQVDSNFVTTAAINIYGGTFTGSNAGATIFLGENGDSGNVKPTLHIYNGSFTAAQTILNVGSDDSAYIHNGVFNSTGAGNMFTTQTNSKLFIEGGKFSKPANNCNIYFPGNNSVLTITGGDFECTTFVWCNNSANFTVNMGEVGGDNSKLTVFSDASLFGTDGKYTGNLTFNVYSGTYEVNTSGNTIYIYGACSGAIKLYGGDFWEYGGGSRMFRIGGSFNGTLDIYGGTYKQESGSDLLCVVDSARVDVTFGCEDGTGPVMLSANQAVLEYSANTALTTPVSIKVLAGTFTVTGGTESVFTISRLPAGSEVLFTEHVTVTAESGCKGYALYFAQNDATCTINGGNYYAYGNTDSTITCGNGTLTINAGYFYGKGMCVARAIGGTASTQATELDKGFITTPTTATLIVNGGVFFHDENWERNGAADGYYNDAVIRAGGWTGYGTVELNGGTFIANGGVGERVINKYNPASTIRINGGVYLANHIQKYYFMSTGDLYDKDTGEMIGEPDPDIIEVDHENDMQLVYGGVTYSVLILDDLAVETYKVTDKAEIRVSKIELGEQDHYITGLRFTTTISKTAIDQFKTVVGDVAVTFGTLIVPKDFLTEGVELTHESLAAAGLICLDIPAADSLSVDADGNVTFTAAIVEILPENYGRDFVAVGYMKARIADPNGTPVEPGDSSSTTPADPEMIDVYGYSEYDENGTSLAELAQALLEAEINEAYPYSDEFRALLQTWADALPEDDGTDTPNVPVIPGDKDDVIEDEFGDDSGKPEEGWQTPPVDGDEPVGDGENNGGDPLEG